MVSFISLFPIRVPLGGGIMPVFQMVVSLPFVNLAFVEIKYDSSLSVRIAVILSYLITKWVIVSNTKEMNCFTNFLINTPL